MSSICCQKNNQSSHSFLECQNLVSVLLTLPSLSRPLCSWTDPLICDHLPSQMLKLFAQDKSAFTILHAINPYLILCCWRIAVQGRLLLSICFFSHKMILWQIFLEGKLNIFKCHDVSHHNTIFWGFRIINYFCDRICRCVDLRRQVVWSIPSIPPSSKSQKQQTQCGSFSLNIGKRNSLEAFSKYSPKEWRRWRSVAWRRSSRCWRKKTRSFQNWLDMDLFE